MYDPEPPWKSKHTNWGADIERQRQEAVDRGFKIHGDKYEKIGGQWRQKKWPVDDLPADPGAPIDWKKREPGGLPGNPWIAIAIIIGLGAFFLIVFGGPN